MDAFKLLTRSTKLKTGANPRSGGATPSTGKAENPQLFRNSEGDKILVEARSGKKRKRGLQVERDSRREEDDDVAELDFFNAGGKKSAPVASSDGDAVVKKNTKDDGLDDDDSSEDVMDEVQRRTVLNAHKIKVTDLRDLDGMQPPATTAVQNEEPTKKKKKKAKKEEAVPAAPTKKEQKKARRLFPQPLVSFKELRSKYKIPRGLAENIADQGFTVPTEVQLGTLPLLLGESTGAQTSKPGKGAEPDLLVVAPTGSGKTLAFLIPVINKICRHHHEHDERGVFSVVVAPTRELAGQIVNEGRKLVAGTGVKITMMKKGMRVSEREGDDEHDDNDLDKDGSDSDSDGEENAKDNESKRKQVPITKSDIIVTTPLLLVNTLSENRTKPVAPMPLVRSLVLDEADVLLDPLFREQTLDIWRSCTNPELRVSLWSATMGSNIEELTKSSIKERYDSIEGIQSSPFLRLVVGLKDSAIPNIHHKLVYAATEQGKLLGLRQLLHPSASSSDVRLRPPFLIFTQTIPRAIALHSELRYDIPPEAGGSARIAVLHSDLSDNQRSEIMKGFRKGEIWILVTTDLLARGVDFRGINGVVNYDIPNSAAVYVHRVGRTGRAGREGGIAVTYYTKEDIPYVKNIANVINVSEKLRGGPDGEKSVQKWLLDALPDLSKRNKQELKKHGVKARQSALNNAKDNKEHRRMRISTKSGFERRQENKKKALIEASQKRKNQEPGSDDNWSGFD